MTNHTTKPIGTDSDAFEILDASGHRIGDVFTMNGKKWIVDPVGKSQPRDTYKTRDQAITALVEWMKS